MFLLFVECNIQTKYRNIINSHRRAPHATPGAAARPGHCRVELQTCQQPCTKPQVDKQLGTSQLNAAPLSQAEKIEKRAKSLLFRGCFQSAHAQESMA